MHRAVSTVAFALILSAGAAAAQTIPVPRAVTAAPKANTVQQPSVAQANAAAPQRSMTPEAMVERVSLYLSSMRTLSGDFVQVGPDGRRTEGQFYVQKPGKVRFEY